MLKIFSAGIKTKILVIIFLLFGFILLLVSPHSINNFHSMDFCTISDYYFMPKCLEDNLNENMKNVVPIVFALDDNYTIQTVIAITSICINTKNTTYNKIYALVKPKFSDDNKKKLLKINEIYPSQCQLTIINMKSNINMKIRTSIKIPSPAYYRLKMPSLFPEYDKMIYLDGDTITLVDLMEMYNLDLGNNYVLGFGSILVEDVRRFYKDEKVYVSSGILLMNLYLMRKDNIEEKFSNFTDKNINILHYHDQTTLNAVCIGKIGFLPPKWGILNFANEYAAEWRIFEMNRQNQTSYTKEEYIEAYKYPSVIHYNYPPKPWEKKTFGSLNEIFYEYAERSCVSNEFFELLEKNDKITREKEKQKREKREKRLKEKMLKEKNKTDDKNIN